MLPELSRNLEAPPTYISPKHLQFTYQKALPQKLIRLRPNEARLRPLAAQPCATVSSSCPQPQSSGSTGHEDYKPCMPAAITVPRETKMNRCNSCTGDRRANLETTDVLCIERLSAVKNLPKSVQRRLCTRKIWADTHRLQSCTPESSSGAVRHRHPLGLPCVQPVEDLMALPRILRS